MREFSEKYLDLLKNKFSTLNLTRILDSEEFYHKQILDSVLPADQWGHFASAIENAQVTVDIGFGGGFPLLPLAKKFPDKKFVGIEARGKKARAVNQIASELGLSNVRCHHLRLEQVLFDVPAVATLKAVGKIPDFLKLFHVEQATEVFFYKGPNVDQLEDLSLLKGLGWKLNGRFKVTLEGVEAREILAFANETVPRGTKKNKELVKLSSLI